MKSEKKQNPGSGKKQNGSETPTKPKLSQPEPRLAPCYSSENLLPYPSDPPVPNRAWTEMRLGRDIDTLSEEEKADLYLGHDHYF